MGNLKIFSLVCVFFASGGVLVDHLAAATNHIELSHQQDETVQQNPLYAFLDPRRSLTFEQMLEILRSQVEEKDDKFGSNEIFYRDLPEYPGPKLADLIELASHNRVKCTEIHFRRLVAWRQHLNQQAPLAGYLKSIIKNQRRFCDEFLNDATSTEVASFGELTKAHFELFLKQDRIGQDFYVSPDSAITKLRSLIGEPKPTEAIHFRSAQIMSQSGQNFLRACREITTKLGPLVPIRKDQEIFARLPLRHENYFRVYNFCHNLIDFDFSTELQKILFLDVQSRKSISEFGNYLAEKDPPGSQATTNDDIERQIPRAAMKYAARLASRSQMDGKRALEESLDHLRRSCFSSLDLVENLLWLRQHNLEGLRPNQMDKRAHQYLKALSACNKLVRLDIPEILKHGQDEQTSEDRKKSNPILNILLRIMRKH